MSLTPFQRQQRPLCAARAPLAALVTGNDVSVRALAAEIRALEAENTALSKRVSIQDGLIRGLCSEIVALKK